MKYNGFYFANLRLTLLLRKISLIACVESAVRCTDERFLVLQHGSAVEEIVTQKNHSADWVALLMAYGCDVETTSDKNPDLKVIDAIRSKSFASYARARLIQVLILLVGSSMIPRVRPKVWVSKDIWRTMATFY